MKVLSSSPEPAGQEERAVYRVARCGQRRARHAAAGSALKCVILTGAGSAFSAGFDLSEFQTAFGDADFRAAVGIERPLSQGVVAVPDADRAAVNGPALGGGMDTAVLCDIKIMSDAARFGHRRLRLATWSTRAARLIGGAAARELCITGVPLTVRGLRLGLASEVVRQATLPREVSRLPGHRKGRTRSQAHKAKIIARAAIDFRATLEL